MHHVDSYCTDLSRCTVNKTLNLIYYTSVFLEGTDENHKETKWILHAGRYSNRGEGVGGVGCVSTASPSESKVSVFLIASRLLQTCYHNPAGKERVLF